MSMKKGNWIPIDRNAVYKLSPTAEKGQYSEQSAYLSLREDLEKGKPKGLRAYARIWKWSRGKVEKFFKKINYKAGDDLNNIKKRHFEDTLKTPVSIVFNDLPQEEKTKRRHLEDTTINPNPNPKDQKKNNGRPANETEVIEYLRQLNKEKPEYWAEKFYNHYEANGWVQGKGKPIKDWKACVKTWKIPNAPKEIWA